MRQDRDSAGEIILWGALGAGVGLVAGTVLSEWLGDVNRGRLRRAARRLQERPARSISPAAGARAAEAALADDARLAPLGIQVRALRADAVELRGWVPDRASRALAARVVRAVPGIENVVNSILVRGEDDRSVLPIQRDQPA
ncbi:MAG TPA: BON domain-containing protein [Gemmatimonadales bacterium]|nr:BON domain-containing protein [Gemmatimonadales bacterium]